MDILRIEQVLMNLVSNAAKYSDPDTNIDINCSSNAVNLIVCVRDQGIGISKQNINRIFDKYFREEAVTDKYGGFVLGLFFFPCLISKQPGRFSCPKKKKNPPSFFFFLPCRSVLNIT